MAAKLERGGKKLVTIKTDELRKLITKDNKKRNAKIRKELARRNEPEVLVTE